MKKINARYLTQSAIIAALYVTLTFVFRPISFGPIQVRVAEALCVLPFFTPAAIPGLFIGCLIGNGLGSNLGLMDVILGSLATLASAYLASKIKKWWLIPLPAVIINALVVGFVLYYVLGADMAGDFPFLIAGSLYLTASASVLIGQAIACYGGGLLLFWALKSRSGIIKNPLEE